MNADMPSARLRGRALRWLAGLALVLMLLCGGRPGHAQVLIGLDAEFGAASNAAAEAIRRGILSALDEINTAGGVLGGQLMALEVRDNRGAPARATRNFAELAVMPNMAAIFGGQLAPTAAEMAKAANRMRVPLLAPWSATDEIRNYDVQEDFVFRLSLRDKWAMRRLLERAAQRGWRQVAFMVLNNAWGRSNQLALTAALQAMPMSAPDVEVYWHNLNDQTVLTQYIGVRHSGADGIILVALETQLQLLLGKVAALPPQDRLPMLSHWSIFGTNAYPDAFDNALGELDLEAVYTTLPERLDAKRGQQVLAVTERLFGITSFRAIPALAGFVHAYDLTHILARAINLAGSTDPNAIRQALEQVSDYDGLLRSYPHPFAPGDHEALGYDDVLLGRLSTGGSFQEVQP